MISMTFLIEQNSNFFSFLHSRDLSDSLQCSVDKRNLVVNGRLSTVFASYTDRISIENTVVNRRPGLQRNTAVHVPYVSIWGTMTIDLIIFEISSF